MFVGSSYGGSIMGGPYEYSPIQNRMYFPTYLSQSFKVSGNLFLCYQKTISQHYCYLKSFSQGFGNVLEPSNFKSLEQSKDEYETLKHYMLPRAFFKKSLDQSEDEYETPKYHMLPRAFFTKRSRRTDPDMDVFTATRG